MKSHLRRRSYALTDIGRKRPQNEDAFLADDTLGLYVVADGVGGHAKGEVASAESVEQVRNFVCSGWDLIDGGIRRPETVETMRIEPLEDDDDPDAPRDLAAEARLGVRRLLESAVQHACYFVFGIAQLDPEGQGMSTTLSALLLTSDHAFVAQVGDSRVYRYRGGRAHQVTVDHTLLNHQLALGLITPEEALTAKGRNVITRAVGHRDYVEVDTFSLELLPGDRFLICSDGLHAYLRDDEVDHLLAEPSVEGAARRAIDLANGRGGRDNITAVVVAVR